MKQHSVSVTPKMVKNVIMNLDLSTVSGSDCTRVVLLKNCEPEYLFILAKIFNCFWKSLVSKLLKDLISGHVVKNVGERSATKNYYPVSLLSVVGKVFEKFVNSRIVITLSNVAFFLISSMVLGLLDSCMWSWRYNTKQE